jgi:uncharacterized RDD family membrane protein YckC
VRLVTDQQAGSLPAASSGSGVSPSDPDYYPGEDLGLPKTGRGSAARVGRRLGALFIDWLLCTFVVVALIRPHQADVGLWTLLIFAAQDFVLTSFTGFTVGKRLLGIRVAKLDGTWVGLLWGLLRTVMLLTLVLPLWMDHDQRGLHDRATNTIVVRV